MVPLSHNVDKMDILVLKRDYHASLLHTVGITLIPSFEIFVSSITRVTRWYFRLRHMAWLLSLTQAIDHIQIRWIRVTI